MLPKDPALLFFYDAATLALRQLPDGPAHHGRAVPRLGSVFRQLFE
ncbi:MAG: hypothetical protein ACREQY_04175 [Candidatus Binatia bacterium]